MSKHTPKAGERFYYTGDMANLSGFGVVEKIEETRFGTLIHCAFDPDRDGKQRPPTRLTPASFEPGPGRRFWREEEYMEDRRSRIEAMEREQAEYWKLKEAK